MQVINEYSALSSRNFQNVKLRLEFITILSFYRHSNPITYEIEFWQIKTVRKCHFLQFQRFSILIWATFKSQIYQKFKVQGL